MRSCGETVVCAFLSSFDPPVINDHTGTFALKCPLPTDTPIEIGDLYLFLFQFNSELGQYRCCRMTPIPRVLYSVYQKILSDYRSSRNKSMK
ncbi:unnamed protein product [Caenorhabditis bovis]|uniref:Uncharacterized protein n=1 Tax=Caenorhabditis bovis TaxID=2654633 RepID=A0A8S1EVI5_9PELO|nr:unnamed protein product [Caenorhabditis bovis]